MKQVLLLTLLLSSISLFAQESGKQDDAPWAFHLKIGSQNISEFNIALEYKTSPSSAWELEASYRYPFLGDRTYKYYEETPGLYSHPFRRGFSIRPSYIHYFNKKEKDKGAYTSLSPGLYLGYFHLKKTFEDAEGYVQEGQAGEATVIEKMFSPGPMLNLGIHFRQVPWLSLYITGGIRFNYISREASVNGGPWEDSFYTGRSPIGRVGLRIQLF